MRNIKSFPLELFFWVTALVLLASANAQEHHYTLCPLANLGLEGWCPGCGLGRSITYIFHGQFAQSFSAHWFGFPALLIIGHRIYKLIKHRINKKNSTINT